MICSIFSDIIPKPQNWCPEKFEMDTRKTKWKGYFSVLCTEKNIIICLYFRLTSIKKHQQKMHHVTWYPGFSKQIIWQQDLSGRIQATMQQNTNRAFFMSLFSIRVMTPKKFWCSHNTVWKALPSLFCL